PDLQLRGLDPHGHGVHRQLVAAPGPRDPRQDHPRGAEPPRRLLTRRLLAMSAQPAINLPIPSTLRPRKLAPVTVPPRPPVSVIVPCYDEAQGIPALLARLETLAPLGWEFVFVDDGSRDDTFATLLEASRTRPWMRVVRHGANMGLGAA